MYNALIECLKTKSNVFPKELLQDTDTIAISIKNYNLENGLSQKFYNDSHRIFEIAGQYGKGLMINNDSNRVYFAFAAGTGVLVFIDLVVKLILQSVGAFPP